MRIGELALATRTKVSAVRYYERLGLVQPARRTRAGYRDYGDEALQRLSLIRGAKSVGFTLREIRELLNGDANGRDSSQLRQLVDTKLAALRARRGSLSSLERELLAVRTRINTSGQSRELSLAALNHTLAKVEVAPMNSSVPGWVLAGSRPESYEIGIADETKDKNRVAYLRSTTDVDDGFGTLMQQVAPDAFLGSRLRFGALIRTEAVRRAGLWLRIDGPGGQQLDFDNLQSRPITGTTDWTPYAVVLDVDSHARNIAFGVLLIGGGNLRIADCVLERVSTDVVSTAPRAPTSPRSLDFSERASAS